MIIGVHAHLEGHDLVGAGALDVALAEVEALSVANRPALRAVRRRYAQALRGESAAFMLDPDL